MNPEENEQDEETLAEEDVPLAHDLLELNAAIAKVFDIEEPSEFEPEPIHK